MKHFHLNHREVLYEFQRSLDAIEEVVWFYKTKGSSICLNRLPENVKIERL